MDFLRFRAKNQANHESKNNVNPQANPPTIAPELLYNNIPV